MQFVIFINKVHHCDQWSKIQGILKRFLFYFSQWICLDGWQEFAVCNFQFGYWWQLKSHRPHLIRLPFANKHRIWCDEVCFFFWIFFFQTLVISLNDRPMHYTDIPFSSVQFSSSKVNCTWKWECGSGRSNGWLD